MIREVHIGGFKSVPEMKIQLGKLNVLIGANGAGKSNILEAIGVLGAAANGKVDDASLLSRGVRAGLPRLYKTSFRGQKTPVHIHLGARGSEGEEFRVSLLNPLSNPEPAWNFKTEFLSDETGKIIVSEGVRSKRNVPPSSGLAALQVLSLPTKNRAAALSRRLQEYSIYTPTTTFLRGMQADPQTRAPLGLSGGRLAEAIEEFKKRDTSRQGARVKQILELVDWVSDVDVATNVSTLLSPSVSRTRTLLKFTDKFMQDNRNTLTAYDASEGALYVLFVALLALSEQAPKFLAVDNLDQALNPRLAKSLVSALSKWLLDSKDNRQWIVTTHNPAILDGLDLEQDETKLFAVERNNLGHTGISQIELTQSLVGLLRDYPLSRLWLMGNLGAVPNV